jgi:hypothetical protein
MNFLFFKLSEERFDMNQEERAERTEKKAERLTEALRLLEMVKESISQEEVESAKVVMKSDNHFERLEGFVENNRLNREKLRIEEIIFSLKLLKGIENDFEKKD